jgi:hypothetical protein
LLRRVIFPLRAPRPMTSSQRSTFRCAAGVAGRYGKRPAAMTALRVTRDTP